MDQAVTEFIEKIKTEWQIEICNQLRQLVYESVPDVEEKIQYGKPHYRKNGKYVCVIGTAKDWVNFTIFNATQLEAPEGFFEASDVAERKSIKIRKGQSVDYAFVAKLVKQAGATL